jgi:hypothetical protein
MITSCVGAYGASPINPTLSDFIKIYFMRFYNASCFTQVIYSMGIKLKSKQPSITFIITHTMDTSSTLTTKKKPKAYTLGLFMNMTTILFNPVALILAESECYRAITDWINVLFSGGTSRNSRFVLNPLRPHSDEKTTRQLKR